MTAKKTRVGSALISEEADEHVGEVKRGLLRLRRRIVITSYEGDDSHIKVSEPLEEEQVKLS